METTKTLILARYTHIHEDIAWRTILSIDVARPMGTTIRIVGNASQLVVRVVVPEHTGRIDAWWGIQAHVDVTTMPTIGWKISNS